MPANKRPASTRLTIVALAATATLSASCNSPQDTVRIQPAPAHASQTESQLLPYSGKLDPIPRYGGYVLTAQGMPNGEAAAYLWAKNMGTLVA